MKSSKKHFFYFMFSCFLILPVMVLAKGQIGDPFGAPRGLLFPMLGTTKDLNSLQVLAAPLAGEPFFNGKYKNTIFLPNDNAKHLLSLFSTSHSFMDNLFEINNKNLRLGSTSKHIWSSHLFPTAKGGVSRRYLVYQAEDYSWEELNKLHQNTPAGKMIEDGKTDLLSPLEKYEYLTGNTLFNLSIGEWIKGSIYQERYQGVPTWIGLCHGSAPSSYMNKQPLKNVRVRSYNNHQITFTTTDLKALIAFSWAQSGGPSRLMGSRCGQYLLPNIRPSQNCLDTNPASMHLALINQVGLNKRPLIADTSAGPEVWNKVVKGYEFSYFHPRSRNLTTHLSQALTDIDSLPKDPFKNYRSTEATNIVGVSMEVIYSKEKPIEQDLLEPNSENAIEKIRYWYDLEINSNGVIIGGEWHSQIHPDFIWVIADNYKPRTIYDYAIEGRLLSYHGDSPLSPHIRSQAINAASEGEILYDLVERLIDLSQ